MGNLNRLQFSWRDVVFADIVLAVVLADQLSKFWIVKHLLPGDILWDAGFLQIIHVQNTGAAFGIFKDHTPALIAVDFIGIFVILFLVFGLRNRWPFIKNMLVLTGIGLILGGTIGNLIDRLRPPLHQVTDFLDLKIWPVFNVADASVTIGVIILAFCLIFMADRAKFLE
jgi:signal peptidase II